LRPGSLSTQCNVCGSPGWYCKPDSSVKHARYCQGNFTRQGNSNTKYVKKEDLPEVRKQLKNYQRMKL